MDNRDIIYPIFAIQSANGGIMDIFDNDSARHVTRTSVLHAADWFFWLAILSVVNSLIVFYYQTPNTPLALGITQWLDGTSGSFNGFMSPSGLLTNILIAGVLAAFGLIARRGSDIALVVGIFLYVLDSFLIVGLRDLFGFGVHLIALFFLVKGLLASRHLRENAVSI
ncbi:MAG: hypothetical protein ABJB34_06465 [Acidobacteriota bacterium]